MKYTASLKVQGKVYTGTGKTVSDAILKVEPGVVKGVGILTLSNDKESAEKILSPITLSRLFNSRGVTREVAVQRTAALYSL